MIGNYKFKLPNKKAPSWEDSKRQTQLCKTAMQTAATLQLLQQWLLHFPMKGKTTPYRIVLYRILILIYPTLPYPTLSKSVCETCSRVTTEHKDFWQAAQSTREPQYLHIRKTRSNSLFSWVLLRTRTTHVLPNKSSASGTNDIILTLAWFVLSSCRQRLQNCHSPEIIYCFFWAVTFNYISVLYSQWSRLAS